MGSGGVGTPCSRTAEKHVFRPRKRPAMTQKIFWLALVGPVLAWKDAGINPAATGGGAVILQLLIVLKQFSIGDSVAVDLLKDLLRIRFGVASVRAQGQA